MDEYFYRFRSAERLLGEAAELENSEIYFSPPSGLNDPLEGYLKTYWSADPTAWTNLFKHYLYSLTKYYLDVALWGGHAPVNENITMPTSLESGNKDGQKILDLVFLIFKSNKVLIETVESFAYDEAKITEAQLSALLFPLHQELLFCVYKACKQLNQHDIGFSFLEKQENERERVFKEYIIPLNKSSTDGTEDFREEKFSFLFSRTYQEALLIKYHEEKERPGFNFIAHGFPSAFIIAMKRMMHSDWYVACFMSKCHDSAIWGSYGINHTGLCLKYKAQKTGDNYKLRLNAPVAVSNTRGIIFEYRDLPLRKVKYETEIQEVNFFTSITNYPESSLRDNWFTSEDGKQSKHTIWLENFEGDGHTKIRKIFTEARTRKLEAWMSENEYRVIISPSIFSLNGSQRCIKYDFNSLEGIIFGIRTTTETKIRAMKIVKKLMIEHHRTEFSFYQASYDDIACNIRYDKMELINL